MIAWACTARYLARGDMVAIVYQSSPDVPQVTRAWRVVWADGPWSLVVAWTDAPPPETYDWGRWGVPPDEVIARSVTQGVMYDMAADIADAIARHLRASDLEDRKTCFQSQN